MNISTSYSIHQLNIEMNRAAERELRRKLAISYSRFYFLVSILQNPGVSQHALAKAMGYSDPAVSTMCAELIRDGLIKVTIDPQHRRRRAVNLTGKGQILVEKCLALLDACFTDVIIVAGVPEPIYGQQTQALLAAMQQKNRESL